MKTRWKTTRWYFAFCGYVKKFDAVWWCVYLRPVVNVRSFCALLAALFCDVDELPATFAHESCLQVNHSRLSCSIRRNLFSSTPDLYSASLACQKKLIVCTHNTLRRRTTVLACSVLYCHIVGCNTTLYYVN